LLVSWCAGGRRGIACNDEDQGRSRRPGAEDRGWSHKSVLGDRAVERSGDTVCGLHLARGDEERGFLGGASKPRSTICEWFVLKTTRMVSSGLASKPVVTVFAGLPSKSVVTVFAGLTSKPVATVFSSLSSKLVATVSPDLASKSVVGFLVEPQNQGGGGFLGLDHRTGSSGLVVYASKSPRRFLGLGLKTKQASVCQLCRKTDGGRSTQDTRRDLAAFGMEASLARVFQSGLKAGGGATASGARDTITEVASEAS
jgi:hypothetical protein